MAEVEEVPTTTQTTETVSEPAVQPEPAQQQYARRPATATTAPDKDPNKLHGKALAIRIIWFINGTLMILLGLRFVLAFLGANPYSGFGNFIYSITQPFVAPFFGVFGYTSNDYIVGQRYVEGYTLLAMLVYTLLAWGITKLILINHRDTTVPV